MRIFVIYVLKETGKIHHFNVINFLSCTETNLKYFIVCSYSQSCI